VSALSGLEVHVISLMIQTTLHLSPRRPLRFALSIVTVKNPVYPHHHLRPHYDTHHAALITRAPSQSQPINFPTTQALPMFSAVSGDNAVSITP
jgi:hypothetical protein